MSKDLSRSVCYYRVSTTRQAEEYSSLEAYRDRFVKFGFKELTKHYFDVASGGKKDREAYQQVLELVKNNEIDTVYIPEISRLSRDIAHFQEALEAFQKSKASLITLDGHQFDLNTPTGALNTNLQVLFAEHTRLVNQHRALQGHKYLREMAKPLRPTFPYIKNADKSKFLPNDIEYKSSGKSTWEVGRELITTYIETKNLSETIRLMMLKYGAEKTKGVGNDYGRNHSSLRDWLKSDVIRGHTSYFKGRRYRYIKDAPEPITIYNTHQPLISPEEAETIEKLLSMYGIGRKNLGNTVNPFVGLLYCDKCGSKMKVSRCKTTAGNVFQYIVCKSAYTNDSSIRAKQELGILKRCDRRSAYGLTLEKLEPIIINDLCQKATTIANIAYPDVDQPINPELVELEEQIGIYRKLAEVDEDMVPVLNKKIKRRDYLLNSEPVNRKPVLRNQLIQIGQDKGFWQSIEFNDRRILYSDFIKKISIDKGVPTVYWNL